VESRIVKTLVELPIKVQVNYKDNQKWSDPGQRSCCLWMEIRGRVAQTLRSRCLTIICWNFAMSSKDDKCERLSRTNGQMNGRRNGRTDGQSTDSKRPSEQATV